ncbi:MAG: hypothetical protein GF333_05195 [Candidatus Omnitrophica bacterium]|nr:hypothetical protein [Candidatus Omnitrophota bacterium]
MARSRSLSPKIAASAVIIQARTGSTRLPGKVLIEINGEPILDIVISRCCRARLPGRVILATTRRTQDTVLARQARACGIGVYRGAEKDVLARFLGAAEAFGLDTVVRVTADNPLVSPALIDFALKRHCRTRIKYSRLRLMPRGTGIEVMQTAALRRSAGIAGGKRYREHVTLHLRERLPAQEKQALAVPVKYRGPSLRLTVDESRDLTVMRKLARKFGKLSQVDTARIIQYCAAYPELQAVNRKVTQRERGGPVVLFRLDAGGRHGYGHFFRSLALFRELRRVLPCRVVWAVKGKVPSSAVPRGVEVVSSARQKVLSVIRRQSPALLIADVQGALNPDEAAQWKRQGGLKIVLFDGQGPAACYADRVVNSLLRCPFSGRGRLCGARYLVLRQEFARARIRRGKRRTRKALKTVLLAVSATDPGDVSARLLKALNQVPGQFTVHAVLPPGKRGRACYRRLLKNSPHSIKVHERLLPRQMAELAAEADIALTGSGITAYECACVGVPLITVNTAPWHRGRILLPEYGFSVHFAQVSSRGILRTMRTLRDPAARERLSRRARAAVDGKGAGRIVEMLVDLIRGKE